MHLCRPHAPALRCTCVGMRVLVAAQIELVGFAGAACNTLAAGELEDLLALLVMCKPHRAETHLLIFKPA